jgi:hypothetical protein
MGGRTVIRFLSSIFDPIFPIGRPVVNVKGVNREICK